MPLLGFIGRLDYQKGVDIITESAGWLMEQDVQVAMLGSGDAALEGALRGLEDRHGDKCKCWVGRGHSWVPSLFAHSVPVYPYTLATSRVHRYTMSKQSRYWCLALVLGGLQRGQWHTASPRGATCCSCPAASSRVD